MIQVTEKDREIIDSWYDKNELNKKFKTVDEFISHLNNDYEHDYGTICHAISAAAIFAAWKMNEQSQGGITGFQAGAVMWEFITHWMTNYANKPLKLVDYSEMCYPQYAYKFEKVISTDTWESIKDFAKKSLKENRKNAHPKVTEHWKSIISGKVPFNYIVED
jgi:hypothetical protein